MKPVNRLFRIRRHPLKRPASRQMTMRIFCFVLSLLILSTQTYAVSGQSAMMTEAELRQKYPDATFYSVTPEKWNAIASTCKNSGQLIALKSASSNIKTSKAGLPEYEVLTAARLKERYPEADFKVQPIDTIDVTAALLSNRDVIIACNTTIVSETTLRKQTFDNILREYPDEKFTVFYPESIEAFKKLRQGLEGVGGITVTASIEKTDPVSDPESADSESESYSTGTPDLNISGSCLTEIPDMGGNDLAVVLFVVVGIFVVAVLVIYGGKFIYDAITNNAENSYSFEISPTTTFFNRERNSGVSEKGIMTGMKLISSIDSDTLQVGLACEAGNMDIELHHDDSGSAYKMDGFYWMAGPHLGFPLNTTTAPENPSCLTLEVLAGKLEHDNAGFISAASAGISFGIREHLRLGFHIGSFYFDLDETEGMLDLDKSEVISTDEDKFRLTFGFEVGYRF